MVRGILQKGAKRREAGVAATRTVTPDLFQMVEKAQDQLRVEVGQGQPGGCLADLRLGEAEQQSEGVAVGGDGARTDSPLIAQMLDEKALKQEGKGRDRLGIRHDDPLRPAPRTARIAF